MKAAIFDMDGTLLDSMNMWGELFTTVLNDCGIIPDKQFFNDTSSLAMTKVADYVVERYSLDVAPADLCRTWQDKIREAYKTKVVPKADVIPYLTELKARGIKLAVATLTEHALADDVIKMHDLEGFFDYVLTPEDVNGVTKVRPDLFLKAAELLGEDPSDSVIFEDSLYAMIPAVEVGFKVYAIADPRAEDHSAKIKEIATKYFDTWQDAIDDLLAVSV